jgi:hypothetical protein
MKYFDKDFWRMTAGFLAIISLGLVGIYTLTFLAR